jgi:tetratricopeptide (TPR) repeat protein
MKHKSEAPKDPKEHNAQIPDDLSKLILKCLEKDKDRRFQSAGEIQPELENIEKGIPTTDTVIPKRKPLTSKEITVTLGLKRLLIPVAVIIALVIIAVVIWQPWSKKAPTPLPSDKPSLAVVYFENNTGDEDLDHWRKGISDLLITDLTQSKYLKVLSGDRLFNILTQLNQLDAKSYTSDVLEEVASRGRVNYILRGSYSMAGDIIRIDIMLQDAGTGEPIATERVEGMGEESIFSLVDDLTRRIKTSIEFTKEQIAGDIDSRIEDITTSSPEALKHYLEGVRYEYMSEPYLSLQEIEKAIALDPNFALAYLFMHHNYFNLGNEAESKKYLQKAYELSEQLPARERYLIQGTFYSRSENTYDKAIEAFNKLLEFYPEHIEGNLMLGIVYQELEQWDKARERHEVLIENKVESVYSYWNLAYIYNKQGMYDKAIGVLEEYLNNFGDNLIILDFLAWNYLLQGKYDLAQAEVDKAISFNLTDFNRFHFYRLQGDIYVCRGDWTLAEKEYLKLFDSEELGLHYIGREKLADLYILQGKFKKAQAQIRQGIELANKSGDMARKSYFHMYLSYLYLLSRSPEKALEECNKAWKIAVENEDLGNQRGALNLKVLIHLEMKSVDEAERVVVELKEMIEKGFNRKLIRFYYHLVGRIELERKNFDRAIEHLKKALSLEPADYGWEANFRYSLAQAYYESGDLEKAQEAYEGIISLPRGLFFRFHAFIFFPGGLHLHLYAKSFYMLGQIYEQLGDTAKAIEHYEKFLSLWKDADPGMPEVDDARERLAGLKSH